MRPIKAVTLVAGFAVIVGALLLFTGTGADSEAQIRSEKSTMWADDVLVHQGYLSRYSRNGYSADYFDDFPTLYTGVACYSSGPDTCRFYTSTDGGESWFDSWPSFYTSETDADVSNPQMVVGEGTNPYVLHFILDQNLGEIILVRRLGFTLDTVTISGGNESFSATRDDPGDNYYLLLAQAKSNGETIFSYSINFGVNWQRADTVDGDQPHICIAGSNGQDVLMTWRLDGEEGAFYGVRSLYERVYKNLTPGTGSWKYYPPFDTSAIDGCPMNIFQASDGSIYVGVDTGPDIFVQKSQDGGETWTSTGDLDNQEDVGDFLEGYYGEIYVATGGDVILRGAKVYKTTDGGTNWNNTGDIGETTDDWAICLARSGSTIYVGTSPQGDVFRSTNVGADWNECGELNGADAIYDMVVTESGTIIAGGEGGDSLGFFRSTNGGDSWFHVEPSGQPLRVRCLFQASDGTILAGADKQTTEDPGIMRSTNDGITWSWTSFSPPGYFIKFIVEASNSYLYCSDGIHVYRSIDHGDIWTSISSSPGLEDMILSKHQIAVKKSTNRGVTWQSAHIVSDPDYSEYSDPKVAGTQGTSSYKVWVAHSARLTNNWEVRYYYSTDQGASWQGSHSLTSPAETQPICDLAVKRGDNSYVHAAFLAEIGGSREIQYARSYPGYPTDWGVRAIVADIRPSLLHGPEISFYESNPLVFFSWGFGISPEHPQHLYMDAQHFTAVGDEDEELSRPHQLSLSQNYPNPFNPVTSIRYTVGGKQTPIRTTLKIYNIKGQLVRILVDEPRRAGTYQVIWDGKSDEGVDVASGVYLYELRIGDNSQTKKMVLIR